MPQALYENALKCFADVGITDLKEIHRIHWTGRFQDECLSACVHKAYHFFDSKGRINVCISSTCVSIKLKTFHFQILLHILAFKSMGKIVTVDQVEICVETNSHHTDECRRISETEECMAKL